jgi:hypothetical protein
MNNEPIYKINGLERRKVKKHLAQLKSFIKNFWHYHNLDKDMYSFYSPDNNSMMSDANAQLLYDSKIEEINKITAELDEPYKSVADIRNEKIESIVNE